MPPTANSIILTGYRATGKSTVGRLVAEELGFAFLDTDQELEKRLGRPISTVVAEQGWPFFRQQENELLLELAHRQSTVIATGGGAILHRKAWQRLLASSLVVWLTAPVAVIHQRLMDDAASAGQRPSLTGANILDEVRAVLFEREPLYRQGSHLAIDTTDNDPAAVARIILNYIGHSHGR